MDTINLVESIEKCCGCGACATICPKNAIAMVEDKNGFIYPKIDEEKCIKCGLCKKTCAFNAAKLSNNVSKAYVAVSKNDETKKKSASGGIFASIAEKILNENGVVYGCALVKNGRKLEPKHIRVDDIKALEALQGSKYVHSNTNGIFLDVKSDLDSNKVVLFSGTPCQIEALRGYLKYKEYENLYTIDLICHGVPSYKMFQDYIDFLQEKMKCNIIDFRFRDKTKVGGYFAKVKYEKNNQIFEKIIPAINSSYYQLFLKSMTCRENCYSCPFANQNRVGDITIGDFWGVGNEHEKYLKDNDIKISEGVSCILVNNDKGNLLIEKYGHLFKLEESNFDKIAKYNKQLNYPSEMKKEREEILQMYKKGYKNLDKWYRKKYSLRIILKLLILKYKNLK